MARSFNVVGPKAEKTLEATLNSGKSGTRSLEAESIRSRPKEYGRVCKVGDSRRRKTYNTRYINSNK